MTLEEIRAGLDPVLDAHALAILAWQERMGGGSFGTHVLDFMRPIPVSFEPVTVDEGDKVTWVPQVPSKCSCFSFTKSPDFAVVQRQHKALRTSAWFALETERLNGEPPA